VLQFITKVTPGLKAQEEWLVQVMQFVKKLLKVFGCSLVMKLLYDKLVDLNQKWT